MPSLPNLISYLKSNPEVPSQQLEKLHKVFFQAAFSGEISLSGVSAALGLTKYETINIVKELLKNSVIEWLPFHCERCGMEINEPLSQCNICGQDITEGWVFQVEGDIPENDQKEYLKFSMGRYDAERFADVLIAQGYMYYLLLDLVESENIQEQDDVQYNEFLEKVRFLIERDAMSQAEKPVLCFGEVGDCLKLAFISPNDPKLVLSSFAEIIRTEPWGEYFPLLEAREARHFPRYDGIMAKIIISPRRKTDIKNIFCITLNGAVDFNDYELTKLFRFDSAIKTDKKIFNNDTVMSVWVQEKTLKDMNWDITSPIEVVTDSHNKEKKDMFGLLAYTGLDDTPTAVINPDEYRVRK